MFDEDDLAAIREAREEWAAETLSPTLDRFGERGVTDLSVTVGYYGLLAGVLNAFAVRPDESVEWV